MAKTQNKKKKVGSEREWAAMPLAEVERVAAHFKALGDPTRLRIALYLKRAAVDGTSATAPIEIMDGETEDGAEVEEGADAAPLAGSVTVGDIACHLTGNAKVTPNISHHLKELRHAGLVEMRRRGKNIFCRLDGEALDFLCRLLASGPAEADDDTGANEFAVSRTAIGAGRKGV